MAYYVINKNKNVNIYKKADTKSTKSDTLTKGTRMKTSGIKDGYYVVSKGYIYAKDVYADNMGNINSGDGEKMYNNYDGYFDSECSAGNAWNNESVGNLVVFTETILQSTGDGIFTYKTASSKDKKTGYINSNCKIIVIDMILYDPITMDIKEQTSCTKTNSEGKWYKIYDVDGSYGGTVKNKWVNMNTYGAMLQANGVRNSSPSTSSSEDDATVIEEKTIDAYSDYITSEEYLKQLEGGLKVEDLRNIFGMPHQFLPLTDPRIDIESTKSGVGEISSFGTTYTEKIINPMPLMMITPGSPEFMTSYNGKQRKLMLEKYLNVGVDKMTLKSLINEKTGKFYSLRYNYTEYFYYVNAMCRSAAFFLNIEDTEIDGVKLKNFNWLWDNSEKGGDIYGHKGLFKFLGTYAGALPFYVDAETSITDSFSNNTSTPSIADTVNGLSEQARELNFILGGVSSQIGGKLDNFVSTDGASENLVNINETIQGMLGKNNILSNITNHVSTLLSGGKMLFPEIWTDSSFSRDYSVKLKFPSPSGDKLSIYLNCLVPVFHCMALTLPRQSTSQGYYSPFLVRAYYKGIFNVDMGIITGMSFQKGSEGEWTDDGLPTVVEVSLDIKDLYNGMFMSKQEAFGDMSILSNITELDYIANMCGINVNEPDVRRTVEMYLSLGFVSNIKDRIQLGIFGNITQWANKKVQKILVNSIKINIFT